MDFNVLSKIVRSGKWLLAAGIWAGERTVVVVNAAYMTLEVLSAFEAFATTGLGAQVVSLLDAMIGLNWEF
jgi:hypothetical protein